jgi:hypothetical protein
VSNYYHTYNIKEIWSLKLDELTGMQSRNQLLPSVLHLYEEEGLMAFLFFTEIPVIGENMFCLVTDHLIKLNVAWQRYVGIHNYKIPNM